MLSEPTSDGAGKQHCIGRSIRILGFWSDAKMLIPLLLYTKDVLVLPETERVNREQEEGTCCNQLLLCLYC